MSLKSDFVSGASTIALLDSFTVSIISFGLISYCFSITFPATFNNAVKAVVITFLLESFSFILVL